VDDANGLLVIRDVKVSDSGIYVCQVSDGINIGRKKVTLTVGGKHNYIMYRMWNIMSHRILYCSYYIYLELRR